MLNLTGKAVETEYCRSQTLKGRSSRKGKGKLGSQLPLGVNEVGYQTPL